MHRDASGLQRAYTAVAGTKGATITDAGIMAESLRVLLVEDSKVLTERLTEAIRQISDVELVGDRKSVG